MNINHTMPMTMQNCQIKFNGNKTTQKDRIEKLYQRAKEGEYIDGNKKSLSHLYKNLKGAKAGGAALMIGSPVIGALSAAGGLFFPGMMIGMINGAVVGGLGGFGLSLCGGFANFVDSALILKDVKKEIKPILARKKLIDAHKLNLVR